MSKSIQDLAVLVKVLFDEYEDITIEQEFKEGVRLVLTRTGEVDEGDYLVELEFATYEEAGDYEEYESIDNCGPSLDSFQHLLESFISNGGTIESIKECIQ
mgnify:CR=1 FL=1